MAPRWFLVEHLQAQHYGRRPSGPKPKVNSSIWQSSQIEVHASYRAVIGPLHLWLRRTGDELHVAIERHPDPDRHSNVRSLTPEPDVRHGDLQWTRWVVGEAGATVQLIPMTPDRPVVVRPEVPLRLPPRQKALFFVNFPLWVKVLVGTDNGFALCEEPCIVLSKTWFGDPMSGTLCYSMRSRARRNMAETQPRPHRAVCPVMINNSAAQPLDIERFCVRVEHLTLFQGLTRLWANQIDITFRGNNEVSQLDYAKDPPTYETVGDIVCEARRPVRESFLEKSLSSLGLYADGIA